MATFPGDMFIGMGLGYTPQTPEELEALDEIIHEESQPTDPLLAVSELEETCKQGMDYLGTHVQALEQRVTDLEERLRSLVFVVNTLCSSMHDVMHKEKE